MSLSILGTGSALPPQVVTNQDLTAFFDTSDEWISTRTGIRRRHIMAEGETVTSLALKAARAALENADVQAKDLDYILCPTLGGDYVTPSLSCLLQNDLGAFCPALDINAACSGFLYSLDVAAGFFARGAKRILVVSAEGLSRIADWTDRSTAVLFGDGAGAVVLAPGDDLLYLHLTSQGTAEPLYMPFPSGNYPNRSPGEAPYLHMDGNEVYKFAVNAICAEIQMALEATDTTPKQVGHVLLHQANLRIIDAARKKLGIPPERYGINIDEVGNLSAASIPVLMDSCNRAGAFSAGELLVLSGFGGGLTTGTAIMRWSRS